MKQRNGAFSQRRFGLAGQAPDTLGRIDNPSIDAQAWVLRAHMVAAAEVEGAFHSVSRHHCEHRASIARPHPPRGESRGARGGGSGLPDAIAGQGGEGGELRPCLSRRIGAGEEESVVATRLWRSPSDRHDDEQR